MVAVQLGIGLYVIPILIGLMGIQRFFERPFQNLITRLAGCVGTLLTTMALFGMEGGKIGARIMFRLSGAFGSIPATILLVFIFLPSLIFALDILYKDFLYMSFVLAKLAIRLLCFLWEALLTITAMFIGAIKTTFQFMMAVAESAHKIFSTSSEPRSNPEAVGNLLPFEPRADKRFPGTKEACDSDESEESPAIPAPRLWNSPSDEPEDIEATPISANISGETPSAKAICGESFGSLAPELAAGNTMATVAPTILHQSQDLSVAISTPSPKGIMSSTLEEKVISGETPATDVASDGGLLKIEPMNQENTPTYLEGPPITEKTPMLVSKEPGEDPSAFLEDNLIDKGLDEIRSLKTVVKTHAEVILPPLDILNVPPPRDDSESESELKHRSELLLRTLEEFGIKAKVTAVVQGPAVSRFEMKPGPGVKLARITSLTDNLALALAAQSIRIEAPIPGKSALGIEIPNSKPTPVFFFDLVKDNRFGTSKSLLNLALGVTISGSPIFANLAEMPHLLIAGSTGSGKSVCINTIISSILFQARADQVKFLMVDPKMVELSCYNGIPHLISPVVTDPQQAAAALLWGVEEMERRYKLLAECGVRKISTYNEELLRLQEEFQDSLEPMPYIVIIIDELADLMMTAAAEVEGSICRLAQMARAVGIHLIIATQRPSVNVLTGIIKANLPSRIAFSVTSNVDSRTILDAKGAERLLGKGDMLFVPKGRNKPLRLQGAFISDREIMRIVNHVKSQGSPDYLDIVPTNENDDEEELDIPSEDLDRDGRLLATIGTYLETQEKTSTSMLQRKFKIGYNRAARLMDLLEDQGIVSQQDGSNKRRVIGRRSSPQP